VLPTAPASHGPNHTACSAPADQGWGVSRTQAVVVTVAVVFFGSRKVRAGPLRTTVRAPSVNVATTAPPPVATTVRGGSVSRSYR
jgi:hypothetical protein